MPIYFANYCPDSLTDRACETAVYTRLRDCRDFMADRRGYIIRQGEPEHKTLNGTNTLLEYCNGFVPTAQDEQNIRNLLT